PANVRHVVLPPPLLPVTVSQHAHVTSTLLLLRRARELLFFRARATEDVSDPVVPLVTRVLDQLVLLVVSVEREHCGPRFRPRRRILDGEPVLERVGSDAREPLGELHAGARS